MFFDLLIYINKYINMKMQTKLTSVNVIDDVYKKFKVSSVEDSMNFQKLVNRSLDLYNTDEEFKKTIGDHNKLTSSNSKF
jgi:hypothetical protein